jgi:hypothetical protein
MNLLGLAMSGGGIRSATFGLGVLQALAKCGLLKSFDYLSTVSGGGYIGSWLVAWVYRESSMTNVELQLRPNRDDQSSAKREGVETGRVVSEEPDPIYHLRTYSNYLTPKLGLFSGDSWTVALIYIRNFLINAITILPILFLLSSLPLLLRTAVFPQLQAYSEWCLIVSALFFFFSSYYIAKSLGHSRGKPSDRRNRSLGMWRFMAHIIALGIISMSVKMKDFREQVPWILSVQFVLDIVTLGRVALKSPQDKPRKDTPSHVILLSALLGLASRAWIYWVFTFEPNSDYHFIFAFPITVALYLIGLFIEIAAMGSHLTESEREWCARFSAWLSMCACAWFVLTGISYIAAPNIISAHVHAVHISGSVAGWIITSIGGALAGSSAKTGRQARSRNIYDWIGLIAPYVFVVGLLFLVNVAVMAIHNANGAQHELWSAGGIFVGSLLFTILFFRIIDVNLFSMHSFYANRLMRCYLAASRPKARRDPEPEKQWPSGFGGGVPTAAKGIARNADLFTGFDMEDDIPLVWLRYRSQGGFSSDAPKDMLYCGPYPIINTALNLVSGAELAWQERMAESFILTPLYCGSERTDYLKLDREDEYMTIGRAMATSGAAANPNMGYHSSPALMALMTFFNVRLGWWISNPNPASRWKWAARAWNSLRSKFRKTAGGAAPVPEPNPAWKPKGPSTSSLILRELLGLTNGKSSYINLSDGGHFDNLGIYELVRRRCKYIVVSDATADGSLQFQDLGNSIRKCRDDFGIRIEIDTSQMKIKEGHSGWHCAVGKVHYEDVDMGCMPGTLVYLKATLTGDEPADLLDYSNRHPDFPHESTVDQFFSESQFESYRALGYHIVQNVFSPHARGGAEGDANKYELFSRVCKRWYSPPPELEKRFLDTVDSFVEVHDLLRSDPRLRKLSDDLYPELKTGSQHCEADQRQAELHMVVRMLQAMENAWLGINLGEFHQHPLNRGWMSVFRRWAGSDAFHRYWPTIRGEFSIGFVEFCETQLGLSTQFKAIKVLGIAGTIVRIAQVDDGSCPRAVPTFDIQHLSLEFGREWSGVDVSKLPPFPQDALSSSVELCGSRLAWLILSHDDENRVITPCGVISVLKPLPGSHALCHELYVWLSGAYRNSRIGRSLMDNIIAEIDKQLAGGELIVKAYHRDDDAHSEMWKQFYSLYQFSRRTTKGKELEMKRTSR